MNWRKNWSTRLKTTLGLRRKADIPASFVVWRGISRLDGKTPIKLVASCVNHASQNSKTGDMIQVAIMRDDVSPFDAWTRGLDGAVCPEACVHRSRLRGGQGTCYVNKARLGHAWRASSGPALTMAQIRERFSGAMIRGGMEGDGSAIPLEIWQAIFSVARGFTGYTAEWRSLSPDWALYFMASCDSVEDAERAQAAGWRPFLTSYSQKQDTAASQLGMKQCPATRETKLPVTCVTCRGCNGLSQGAKRSGYWVPIHGAEGSKLRAD